MSYTVVWKPSAESQLAHFWTSASDRPAITAAADEIDRLLRQNPLEQGESRSGKRRVLFVPPLAVFFEVHEQDRLVTVLRVILLPEP